VDDYQKYRVVMDVVQLLSLGAISITTWIMNRTKATKNAIEQVREENDKAIREQQKSVNELAGKIDLLEREISHLPNHDHLSELHEKVNAVNSTLHKVEGEMKGINRNLSLILESLMQGGNK